MFGAELKKQAKARESVMFLIVILGLCYAGYSTFYQPKKKLAVDLRKQLDEQIEKKLGLEKLNKALRDKNEQQIKDAENQAQMEASIDPKVKMLKDYENSVFKNISEFLNFVTQGDFISSVDISKMRYDPAQKRTGYSSTGFFLDVNGRFNNIIEFINRLEGVPALISIDKITLKVGSKDSNLVNLDLQGTFYEIQREGN